MCPSVASLEHTQRVGSDAGMIQWGYCPPEEGHLLGKVRRGDHRASPHNARYAMLPNPQIDGAPVILNIRYPQCGKPHYWRGASIRLLPLRGVRSISLQQWDRVMIIIYYDLATARIYHIRVRLPCHPPADCLFVISQLISPLADPVDT